MPQDISAFVARRARIAAALREGGGGVAVVPTAPERPRNSDNDHPYRHGSDFHYLTGFGEPS
ncbi:MAG TPA: aminopeptidase P N-terminal domain-containing protein, partial [Caldimonas sp.]